MDQNETLPSFQKGRIVGEWELIERIGRGAMGEVWKAKHHVWQERLAAIKLPTNPLFLDSIRKEGVLHNDLSALQSPHLVKVYGLSVIGQPYLAMELIEGTDLRQRLDQAGKLPLNEALRILAGTLKGLAEAHELGIIHRDLKPENILLDRDGTARLTDLSIAIRSPDAESLRMSIETDPGATHSIAGTLVYMSPEQRQGGVIDRRSDIYSLGLVLFEMLTGDLPQPGDRLKDFVSGVPESIEEVFLRCFTRAERRYSSAREMLVALEDALRNTNKPKAPTAVSAPPQPPSVSRRKATATRARLSTRELARDDAQPSLKATDKPSDRMPAVLSTRDIASVRRTQEAPGPTDNDAPQRKDPVRIPASNPPKSRAADKDDIRRLLDDLADDDPGQSSRPRTSRDGFEEVLPSLQALYRRSVSADAAKAYASGDFPRAVAEYRKLVEQQPHDLANYRGLALSFHRQGKPKQALQVYRQMLEIDDQRADVWNNIGVLSLEVGRMKEAESALLRAIELRPHYASAHSNLAAVYQQVNRPQDAEYHRSQAQSIDPDNLAAGYNAVL